MPRREDGTRCVPYNTRMPLSVLALASYFKGNRFLERCKQEGCTVYLVTVQEKLTEPWARHACDDVFGVPSFHDRRGLINAVAYLMRSRRIDRIVALDDFDVVFGYPWQGEHAMMLDLLKQYGNPEATLLLHDTNDGVKLYRGGSRR